MSYNGFMEWMDFLGETLSRFWIGLTVNLVPQSKSTAYSLGVRTLIYPTVRWLIVIIGFKVLSVLLWHFYPKALLRSPWRKGSQWAKEFKFFSLTMLFGLLPIQLISGLMSYRGLHIYPEISDRGIIYWVFSSLALFVGWDLYFFVIHRWMHTDFMYRKVHYAHHLSNSPQGMTSQSVHPVESFLSYLYTPVLIYFLPIHESTLIVFQWAIIFVVVYEHSAFAPAPFLAKIHRHLINPSYHHYLHHQHRSGNYSFFINIWDRIFQTNLPVYQKYMETGVPETTESEDP